MNVGMSLVHSSLKKAEYYTSECGKSMCVKGRLVVLARNDSDSNLA